MADIKKYNIFILFSTIARNIVEVFSSVLLYKMGYSFKEILIFFAILYFTGAVTSILIMYLTKIIKSKYILILSSIIFSYSFYFMQGMAKTFSNLVIFSIIYGVGCYTYHILRHYYAIRALGNKKKLDIGSILIITNISLIFSSFIASYIQTKFSLLTLVIVIVIISLVAVIPIFSMKEDKDNKKITYQKIEKNKLLFFVLEQAKVIYLCLQPLFLYLFIDNNIKYIGVFNIFVGISSCIFIYFFVRKINDKKYFKYLNILFCITLVLKLNIRNKYFLLFIALLEGLGVKMFEVVSTENIYNIKNGTNISGYLIITEVIFCLVRSLLCIVAYFINNIKIVLYLLIIPIFIIGFIKRKDYK